MEDRAGHGNIAPLLVTAQQARSLFKSDALGKVVIHSDDGLHGIRLFAGGVEYQIGDRDFTKARRWLTRDKAISYICRQLGLPDTISIEFKREDKEGSQK